MKKLGRWLLLLALVFTMFPLYPTETRAETLPLLNGGFDSGLTGWGRLHGNADNMTVTSEIKYSGGFSLKIKDLENNASYAMISDRHPVSAGKQVTASAKLYLSGGTGSVYLYFYNAAGTMMHSVFSNKSSPQTEWTDVSITSGVPDGAVQVSVVLATSIVNVGTAYFDNVNLTASVPLANGGFESGLTGWNAAYGSQQRMTATTEAAFAGVRSLKIDDNSSASSFGMESDKFPVTPGKQYTAEARARVESGGGAVYLRFYNAANQQVDQKATSAGAAPGQWRSVTATLVAPEGAVTASVLLYSALANMGTIYFDEVSVSEISLVRGTVTDTPSGSPVAWAAAYLYDAADTGFETPLDKAVTDINGKYTFSKSMADGSYVVRAAKDGYLRGTATVQVGGTGTGIGAVSLAKDTAAVLYTVSGQVYVPGALQPLAGVNIALYDDDDLAYTTALGAAVSATDGTFTLDRTVPNGRYSARAMKAGYYTAAFPVTVRDGHYTEAFLQMPVKSNVTAQNMPKPPAAHPRLYVTPELVPQLQAKIQTPAFQPIWSKLLGLAYIPQYTGRSSGTTLQMEHYAFPAAENARYVKLFGRGNSTNQWNSITETELYARDTSGQRVKLPVLSADWSSQDRQYDGNNTIDGNLDAESRWSAEGVEEWIRYDLGAASAITDLGIAWYSGNTRTSYFDIYVSGDGQNWRLVDLGLGKQPGLLDPPPVGQSNYSASLKNAIEYNAMKYMLTGDAASGRLAIRTVLNFMDTAVYAGLDTFRPIGETIHAASVTYDWCYPLLTAEEKSAFVVKLKELAGQMSMGYPPTIGGSITGHSGENMLMKDLLAAGIAIYDEDPEMYDLSAARFFNEFVPARNFWYLSGMHHQGDSYGFGVRLMPELWAQWMFARMGHPGVFADEQRDVLYRGLYLRRPDGQLLRDGDTSWQNSNPPGMYWKYSSPIPLLAASYYKDPYLQGEFLRQHTMGSNPFVEILFADPDVPASPVDELPLTRYFGYPYGTMIARTGWEMDSPEERASDVVAEMKIGNYQYGNHQHLDMGSFQLYYKGGLAIDSGMYQGVHGAYGSEHDKHYYKRTIAHNSMLVYDPAEKFYGDWANDGGQRKLAEAVKLDDLLGKNYNNGLVVGHQYGPDPDAPAFSYMKGDLTAAYTDKVEQFKRSFLFLNLKDASHPAAMIVYDKVVSSDPNFKKYWLLHSMEEPQVNGGTTTIARTESGYSGKLVNETLLPQAGNAVIEKVGGPGREFEVFGTNYVQEPSRPAGQHTVEAGAWRIQLSPQAPAETDRFLNVMQVMDNGNASPLPVSTVESERMVGAAVSDAVVLFAKSGDRESGTVSFSVYGNEEKLQFIVTDLAAGSWSIAGGTQQARGEVTADGGVLYFTGAPGDYTLTYLGAQDLVAPSTTAHIDGKSGQGTYNDRDVTVTFSTYETLSGVDRTEYRLNGGSWSAVTDSVYLTAEGVHAFEYRSVDRAGNVEAIKQAVIGIDKTPPVLQLNGSPEMSLLAGSVYADPGARAEDNLDAGVNGRIEATGFVNTGTPGAYQITYRVADAAGNTALPITRAVHVLDPSGVAKIEFDSPVYFMASGTQRGTVVTAVYGDGRRSDVTLLAAYASSNPGVASIANGVIAAAGSGGAVITASYGGHISWAIVGAGSPVSRLFRALEELLSKYAALGELASPLHSQLDNRLKQAEDQWSKGHSMQALKHLGDFLDALSKHSDKVSPSAAERIGSGIQSLIRELPGMY
ncbi:heparin/heparin-sulfate lyase HepB [Paenibacillus hemerocallicola]|nr:heparin/heparin-sulfate lyase HepB [Paenibacillus hemerocallicola]